MPFSSLGSTVQLWRSVSRQGDLEIPIESSLWFLAGSNQTALLQRKTSSAVAPSKPKKLVLKFFRTYLQGLSSLSLFSRMVEKYHGYLMDTPSVYYFSVGWTSAQPNHPTYDFQGEVPLETSWKRGVGTQRLKFSRNEPILSSPGMSYVYFPTKRKAIFGTPECSKSQGWLSLCCFLLVRNFSSHQM